MASLHTTVLMSSIAVVFMGCNALAESLPAEGSVSVTFTATVIPPAKPMPIGGGKAFTLLNQAMAVSNDAGGPVLNNMGGRCQLTHLTDSSAKSQEFHGFCAYTDNDGDQIFEQCDFLPGAPNNCKLIGGSGKFKGLEGALVITWEPVKSDFDGVGQFVGHKKGAYKIVKTP
jgi:hypothetical protein